LRDLFSLRGGLLHDGGDYWPRVVRTARTPDLRGVHPTLCLVSSLLRHMSVETSETLARAGTRGGLVVLEATVGRWKRPDGAPVSMALTSTPHRRAHRGKTAGFQQSPPAASTAGPLMSALWTPSRGPDRLREIMAAGSSALTPAPASPSPAWPLPAPAQGPGGHGSTPTPAHSHPESAYSTRVGIYWPGVVPTARKPQATHPTSVSDVMTSETLRSHELIQSAGQAARSTRMRAKSSMAARTCATRSPASAKAAAAASPSMPARARRCRVPSRTASSSPSRPSAA